MRIVVDEGCYIPVKAHESDAGYDLRSPVTCDIPPCGSRVIDTGVHMALPAGTAGVLISKSGLNVNFGVTSTGLIDSGYTGSVKTKLYNHSRAAYHIAKGDKITQIVIIPVLSPELEVVDKLEQTERGNGGFGSTGR